MFLLDSHTECHRITESALWYGYTTSSFSGSNNDKPWKKTHTKTTTWSSFPWWVEAQCTTRNKLLHLSPPEITLQMAMVQRWHLAAKSPLGTPSFCPEESGDSQPWGTQGCRRVRGNPRKERAVNFAWGADLTVHVWDKIKEASHWDLKTEQISTTDFYRPDRLFLWSYKGINFLWCNITDSRRSHSQYSGIIHS